MSVRRLRWLLLAIASMFVLAGCGSDDALNKSESAKSPPTETTTEPASTTTKQPQKDSTKQFEVTIAAGQPKGGPTVWKVKQGDKVRFTVSSDAAHEVHLHEPYDIEREVEAGGSVSFDFVADTGGSVEFEIEDTSTMLGNLEVR